MSKTNTKVLLSFILIICIMLTTFGLADTRITMSGSISSSTSDTTIGEDNALRVGEDYLDVMGFSYEGLIHQLEYEGFTHEEAVYACDILFERNNLPVKKGSSGAKVKEVQEQLVELGFLTGGIDGIFGGGTEKAVKAFQNDRGLEATGVVDEETFEALFVVVENQDTFAFLDEMTLEELISLREMVDELITEQSSTDKK